MKITTGSKNTVLLYEEEYKCNIIDGVKLLSYLKSKYDSDITTEDEMSVINDFYIKDSQGNQFSLKDNDYLATSELYDKLSASSMLARPTVDLFMDEYKLVVKLNLSVASVPLKTTRVLVIDEDTSDQLTIEDATEYMTVGEIKSSVDDSHKDDSDYKFSIYFRVGDAKSEINYVRIFDNNIGVLLGMVTKNIDYSEVDDWLNEMYKFLGGDNSEYVEDTESIEEIDESEESEEVITDSTGNFIDSNNIILPSPDED